MDIREPSIFEGLVAGTDKVGQALPKYGQLIGITHEQGCRLIYYGWRFVFPWQFTADDELALSNTADP
jgi:hypothetical protein